MSRIPQKLKGVFLMSTFLQRLFQEDTKIISFVFEAYESKVLFQERLNKFLDTHTIREIKFLPQKNPILIMIAYKESCKHV